MMNVSQQSRLVGSFLNPRRLCLFNLNRNLIQQRNPFSLLSRPVEHVPSNYNISTLLFKFKSNSIIRKMATKSFALPERYKGQEKQSVWIEFSKIAIDTKALNLGQGFPDFPPPEYVTDGLAQVTKENVLFNQYTRGFGHGRLVQALGKLYSRVCNRNIDPNLEILVTDGAYEALFTAILGFTHPGDEVIVIEPFFDCYSPMIQAAGGISRFIPLRLKKPTSGEISSADWVLDIDELKSLFNEKTKAIIINNPNNPLGKVFTKQELEQIAALCIKWNTLCISDEVYEWLIYKPNVHTRIATLPGMWDRTVTLGSAGKTFSVTGWKLGWAYGPHSLIKNLMAVHQNTVYVCPTPLQEATARGLELELERFDSPECYMKSLAEELLPKRDLMAKVIKDAGMTPIIPEGGYFMLADWRDLERTKGVDLSKETDENLDYKFSKWLNKNSNVLTIPSSAFYHPGNKSIGESYIRFCFCKKDENLQKCDELFKKWQNRK